MKINPSKLTKEQIEKAMACQTAEELMALAKSEGVELTKDEAEAYLAEMEDYELELDDKTLQKAAGGGLGACWAVNGCVGKCLVVTPEGKEATK